MPDMGNYLPYLDLMRTKGVNAAGALESGAVAGENIANIPTRNALNQYRLQEAQLASQQAQQRQNALTQYGQTQDPAAFRGVDPVMEFKIRDYLQSQPPEGMVAIEKGITHLKAVEDVATPESWPQIKSMIEQIPGFPKEILPAKVDQQQLRELFHKKELFAAQIKQMGQPGKISGGYYMPPGGQSPVQLAPTPVQESQMAKNYAQMGHWREQENKWGSDIALGLDKNAIAAGKSQGKGKPYNEAAAFDKATAAADRYVRNVDENDLRRQLRKTDPEFAKLPEPEQVKKIMAEKEAMRKRYFDQYMAERRKYAGSGEGVAKGGAGGSVTWDAARSQFQILQQRNPQAAAAMLQKYPQLGGAGGGGALPPGTTTENEDEED